MITDHMFIAPALGREDACRYRVSCSDDFCGQVEVAHVPDQPDGITYDSRDLPNAQAAAARVRAYIRESGDGLYDLGAGQPLYARDLEALCRAVQEAERTERSCGRVGFEGITCQRPSGHRGLHAAQPLAVDAES
jgi:hypothetical protein